MLSITLRSLPVVLAVAGCLSGPDGPAPPVTSSPPPVAASIPGEPPPLVPLPRLFANREVNWGYKVSPDGTRLGWIASHARRATIFFRTLGVPGTGIIDTHSPRSIRGFEWTADGRHLLYLQDRDGDEQYHVYLASIDAPAAPPVDLTPWEGATSWVHRVVQRDPEHVVIASNRRDRTVFDLWRLSLKTGEAVLVAENPGDVLQWLTDWEGRPRARLRHTGSGEREMEVLRADRWTPLHRFDIEESDIRMLAMAPDDRSAWLLSGRGRERRALVLLDLVTGVEKLVHEHGRVDLDWVRVSERTRQAQVAFANPEYPAAHFLDVELQAMLAPVMPTTPAGLWILSLDHAERVATAAIATERGSEYFLVERGRAPELLGRSHTLAFAEALGTMEPVSFEARDGERLHGYLTRPTGFRGPGPLVLHVHGGHWTRDYWGYHQEVQFLANRGYAVLQINYRGSTGYGRRFMELAIGEYAGKMHDDLIDGVRWAVTRGISDSVRVAIYGGSYGGYSALVGMTFTPDVFACGISVVGMSNLVTLFDNAPPHWKLTWMPRFVKYMGDPRRPEDRARLEARSPLFKADRAQRPILIIHGARDERVKLSESEQMVEALRRAGKDVHFVVFPDEGHRRDYGNWRNLLRHWHEVEVFLGRCVGGRVGPPPPLN